MSAVTKNQSRRCVWPGQDQLMIKYHDQEWGVPCRSDRLLFEYFILDANQAGLSWRTILHKRQNFRKAYSNFNPRLIARYTAKDIKRLMSDAGIIRNRAKINAAVTNAQCFLQVQKEFGSFHQYLWQFTSGRTVRHHFSQEKQIPARSKESDAMSKDLRRRGFKFVGSTICYAFMQGIGMVNDHVISCFRYKQV